jgi:hypothetical protein
MNVGMKRNLRRLDGKDVRKKTMKMLWNGYFEKKNCVADELYPLLRNSLPTTIVTIHKVQNDHVCANSREITWCHIFWDDIIQYSTCCWMFWRYLLTPFHFL